MYRATSVNPEIKRLLALEGQYRMCDRKKEYANAQEYAAGFWP